MARVLCVVQMYIFLFPPILSSSSALVRSPRSARMSKTSSFSTMYTFYSHAHSTMSHEAPYSRQWVPSRRRRNGRAKIDSPGEMCKLGQLIKGIVSGRYERLPSRSRVPTPPEQGEAQSLCPTCSALSIYQILRDGGFREAAIPLGPFVTILISRGLLLAFRGRMWLSARPCAANQRALPPSVRPLFRQTTRHLRGHALRESGHEP